MVEDAFGVLTKNMKLVTTKQNSWPSLLSGGLRSFFEDDFFRPFLEVANYKSNYPYDLYETETEAILEVPLAGYAKEDISLQVVDNSVLALEVNKQEGKKDAKFHSQKVKKSSFSISLPFGKIIDENAIQATLENGLLKVILPKTNTAENVKKIEIN